VSGSEVVVMFVVPVGEGTARHIAERQKLIESWKVWKRK
jgi:hypothetical protein